MRSKGSLFSSRGGIGVLSFKAEYCFRGVRFYALALTLRNGCLNGRLSFSGLTSG